MYIRFLKLNPHCAFFILLQALYNSHSKKILPDIQFKPGPKRLTSIKIDGSFHLASMNASAANCSFVVSISPIFKKTMRTSTLTFSSLDIKSSHSSATNWSLRSLPADPETLAELPEELPAFSRKQSSISDLEIDVASFASFTSVSEIFGMASVEFCFDALRVGFIGLFFKPL